MARTSTINPAYGSNYMAICLNFPFSFSILHATKIHIMKNLLLASYLLLAINAVSAQQTPIHKNSAGIINSGNDWQFGINSGASFGMNSNEASMFRGNGLVTGLNGQYFWGCWAWVLVAALSTVSSTLLPSTNSSLIENFRKPVRLQLHLCKMHF